MKIEDTLAKARTIFQDADKDKNGWLSHRELKGLLQKHDELRTEFGMDNGTWKTLWNELDADGDGKITEDELIAYLMRKFEDGTLKAENTVEEFLEANPDAVTGDGTRASDNADGSADAAPAEDKSADAQQEDASASASGEGSGRSALPPRVEEILTNAREIFRAADRDKNGWLSHRELKRLLQMSDDLRKQFAMDGGKWKELWNELDADGDGKITEEELITYLIGKYEDGTLLIPDAEGDASSSRDISAAEPTVSASGADDGSAKEAKDATPDAAADADAEGKGSGEPLPLRVEEILTNAREIFRAADHDKNAWLSHRELKKVLQQHDELRKQFGMDGGKWKELWNELDADGDGKITEEELISYLIGKYEDGTLVLDTEVSQ